MSTIRRNKPAPANFQTEVWRAGETLKAGDIAIEAYGNIVAAIDPARLTSAGASGQQTAGKLGAIIRNISSPPIAPAVCRGITQPLGYTQRFNTIRQDAICSDGRLVTGFYVQNGSNAATANIRAVVVDLNSQSGVINSDILLASDAIVNDAPGYQKWLIPITGAYTNSTKIGRFGVLYSLNQKTSDNITSVQRPYFDIYDSAGTLLSSTALAADVNTLWDPWSMSCSELGNGKTAIVYRGITDPTNSGSVLKLFITVVNPDGTIALPLTAISLTDSTGYLTIRTAKTMLTKVTGTGAGGYGVLVTFAVNSSPYTSKYCIAYTLNSSGTVIYPNAQTGYTAPFDTALNTNNLPTVSTGSNPGTGLNALSRVFKLANATWGYIITDYSQVNLYLGTFDSNGIPFIGDAAKVSSNTINNAGSTLYSDVSGLCPNVPSGLQATIADMTIKEIPSVAEGANESIMIVFKTYAAIYGKWMLGVYILGPGGTLISRADASAPLGLGRINSANGLIPPKVSAVNRPNITYSQNADNAAGGFLPGGGNSSYTVFGGQTSDSTGTSFSISGSAIFNNAGDICTYNPNSGTLFEYGQYTITTADALSFISSQLNSYDPYSVNIKHGMLNPLGYSDNIRQNQLVGGNYIILASQGPTSYSDYPAMSIALMYINNTTPTYTFIGVVTNDCDIGDECIVQINGSAILNCKYSSFTIDTTAPVAEYDRLLVGRKATVSGNMLTFL